MKILGKRYIVISRIFFTVFFLRLFLINAQAQQKTEFLSLKEAVHAVISNNSAVQSAKIDEAIAQEKYKQSNAGFLPQVNLSYTALATNNPLYVFGFKLQQRTVTAADFNPDKLNHPSGTSDFTTKIEVLQPLINMDAVYMKKSAGVQVESYQLKTKRTKAHLIFETQKAYHQLQMTHQAVAVLEEALSTAKSIYDFTNNRVLQGLIQKSDLLNVEVQVLDMESNLNEAKNNELNAADYLSVLMNKPTGVLYTTDEMKQDQALEKTEMSLPQNRADLLAIEKAMEATGLMEKSLKMKYLPRLHAFGSYQLNDKKITGFNANSYFSGIQLTWNIFDGNNIKRQVAGLKLEQDKLGVQLHSMQQENQMMLDKSYRDLANALFKIKQQNAAIAQAGEALRILQNRYEEGLVNTTDVLTAQTQLSRQKLMLVQAVFSCNVSQAYIRFLTTTDTSNQN
ncbi:TolC family protein [Agriterribacter sp.]|uniref:TolC family protein n=1 Tax=Agriterribacter sp. TaxID=2821509 RepID=UPI002BF4055E|nr:TolC family protein [Agriterribacter sp.]HTN09260.1 TolC family protein [Agriterribacter sp.]